MSGTDFEIPQNTDADVIAAALKQRAKDKVIRWSDLQAAGKVFPELEESTHDLIKLLLGYSPPDEYVLPEVGFLRVLINDFNNERIPFQELWDKAEPYIKLIRNREIAGCSEIVYSQEDYKHYEEMLQEYKTKVRERLTRFLGYVPALRHSLMVELLLRREMASDCCYFGEGLSTTDMQCLTVIRFREIIEESGKQAALESPLLAPEIIVRQSGKNKF